MSEKYKIYAKHYTRLFKNDTYLNSPIPLRVFTIDLLLNEDERGWQHGLWTCLRIWKAVGIGGLGICLECTCPPILTSVMVQHLHDCLLACLYSEVFFHKTELYISRALTRGVLGLSSRSTNEAAQSDLTLSQQIDTF